MAIGGGGLSAATSIAALSGSLAGAMFAYFTPLPLLAVGLGLGVSMVALAGVAGVALVGIFGGTAAAALYGGIHAFPSWLVVWQALLRRPNAASGQPGWQPIGSVLCLLAMLAGATITLSLFAASGETGVEAAVHTFLDTALSMALPDLADSDRITLVGTINPFFAGGCGATWLIMIIVNTVLAQTILASRGHNLRPSPRWSAFGLPQWFAWPLVAAAAVALLAPGDIQFVARNLVLILATPYFFLGLAVVHCLARRTAAKGALLAAFYLLLALFFVGAAVAIAGLGMIEQWTGVRRRLDNANIDQEEE